MNFYPNISQEGAYFDPSKISNIPFKTVSTNSTSTGPYSYFKPASTTSSSASRTSTEPYSYFKPASTTSASQRTQQVNQTAVSTIHQPPVSTPSCSSRRSLSETAETANISLQPTQTNSSTSQKVAQSAASTIYLDPNENLSQEQWEPYPNEDYYKYLERLRTAHSKPSLPEPKQPVDIAQTQPTQTNSSTSQKVDQSTASTIYLDPSENLSQEQWTSYPTEDYYEYLERLRTEHSKPSLPEPNLQLQPIDTAQKEMKLTPLPVKRPRSELGSHSHSNHRNYEQEKENIPVQNPEPFTKKPRNDQHINSSHSNLNNCQKHALPPSFKFINYSNQDLLPQPQKHKWDEDEHLRFLNAIETYGIRDHVNISKYVQTRNPDQISAHLQSWQKTEEGKNWIASHTGTGRFTKLERKNFLEAIEKYGIKDYVNISSHIKTRTPEQMQEYVKKWLYRDEGALWKKRKREEAAAHSSQTSAEQHKKLATQ